MAPIQVCRYCHVQNSLVPSIQLCLEAGHPIKIIMQYNSVLEIIVYVAYIKMSVWSIIRSNDATDIVRADNEPRAARTLVHIERPGPLPLGQPLPLKAGPT